jgi:hypothetical protein
MKSNLVIIVVALIVAAGVGYYAYGLGHDKGVADATAVRSTFFGDQQRFPAQGAGRGQAGQGGQAQGNNGGPAAFFAGLQGTVDKVDGNTLTVSVQRGGQTQSIKVTLSDSTTVQEFAAGSLTDVKTGSRILIGVDRTQGGAGGQAQGGQTQGGVTGGAGQQIPSEITARTITVLPANFTQ